VIQTQWRILGVLSVRIKLFSPLLVKLTKCRSAVFREEKANVPGIVIWRRYDSKAKCARFNDSIIVTKSISVEATGCERLAQSRYAAAP